jgi:hypothetical protein
MTALDHQVSGTHYKTLAVQPVEFIMSNQMGFCEGNVVKYVTRWRSKGGLADLQKARHFIQFIEEGEKYRRALHRVRGAVVFRAWWDSEMHVDHYIERNQIQNPEAGVIRHIAWWNHSGRLSDLEGATKWLDELIAQASL